METKVGIWIDSSKAIIIQLEKGQHTLKEIVSQVENRVKHEKEGDKGTFMGKQHLSDEKKFDRRKEQQLERFFDKVLSHLSDVESLYLFGPGETKTQLAKKVSTDNELSNKLKKVETADSMTQNQVVAQVKAFFSE